MKRQLYLYLFIISALVAGFTYMYFSKALAFEKKKNESELKYFKDSIIGIYNKLEDANHFSLEYNDNAKEYFADYDVIKLMPQIKDALLAFNDNPKGNIYTGQEKLGIQKFIINKIKILNHRWIIADYSDGQYWGDVVLKYFVEKDGKITFQIMDSFIYPKQEY
jgi:hypothetical protein